MKEINIFLLGCGVVVKSLLEQLKKRRLSLGLKQRDMMMRIGVSRQQYQQIESKGNPRLNTLELIAKGLNCELLLVPKEKLNHVNAVLKNEISDYTNSADLIEEDGSQANPWIGLLEDFE